LIPPSVRDEAFGVLISGIEGTLGNTDQDGWTDLVAWLRKG
jgi:hypothetical protein